MTKSRKLAYLALISAAFIWGIATPIIKYTLRFISPVEFLYFRFLTASLIIAIPLFLRINKIRPSKKDWLDYLFLGFLCTPFNLFLLFTGLKNTMAIDASLISVTSPFLVAVGGAIFLKENVTKKERLGIGIAIIGTLIIIAQPFFENVNKVGTHIKGNFLVLSGTLVWVAFTLIAKKKKHLDPFILSSFSFLIGLISFFPLFLSSPANHYSSIITHALPGILFMSIFGSVIAYSAHIYGLSKIEASEATVFTYLQPIFSVPVSTIFLKEKVTIPFLIGAFIITAGVLTCGQRQKSLPCWMSKKKKDNC